MSKVLKEIKKNDFERIRSLFEDVFFNLNSLAVINGDNDGRIWVDDIENPQTGMIVDNEWAIYVAGKYTNKGFNKSACEIIKNEILPKAEKHTENANPEYNSGEWVIYYNGDEWFKAIEQDFGVEDFLPLRRFYYTFKHLKIPNWRDKIPENFSIQQVDKKFLQKINLIKFEEVDGWISTRWRSIEDFLSRGFGFCLVKDDKEIISWGMADWVTENQAEMGIGTSEEYRRQGFATLVTSATAEYCQKNQIKLGWHCSEHNDASWKTAEKVGFVKEREYTAALRYFDDNYNLWENAWYRGLYLKVPEEGLYYINKLIKKIKPEARHLFIKAQILLEAGKNEDALTALYETLDLGPQNIERFKSIILENDFFKPVRQLEKFRNLVEKIDNVLKSS
ncbi:MAG: GNAT family N-acetyltransferase [Asgard group archaeon]|nr:GNAT family N-acetyltransferase [Asgard group archaeon]